VDAVWRFVTGLLYNIIKEYVSLFHENIKWEPWIYLAQHINNCLCTALARYWIEVIDWPPYSPGLNPIENLWAIMKQEIYKLYPDFEHAPDSYMTCVISGLLSTITPKRREKSKVAFT
jgi:hypothetical protein